MSVMPLHDHQIEAVDAILRALQTPSDGPMPWEGLRTQAVAATGSGKTRVAVEVARRLRARRVLVLVPTRDLLMQMTGAWRSWGRTGAMVGLCSLRASESQGVPCTTDAGELVSWTRGLDQVTVFATYSSLGRGRLQQTHAKGLPAWDLVVVDEAHRTSGDAGKPWASIHDQGAVPASRRLYMTATPRVWEASEAGQEAGRLVASMEPDSPVFGPRAYELSLSEAIRRQIVAPYQVLCLDIHDPELQHALTTDVAGSDVVRGARLAALQTGLLKAAAEKGLRKVLSFHSRTVEAQAMAAGVPEVAERLHQEDPDTYPPVRRVWAEWLYADHEPGHRRAVLEEFGSDVIEYRDGRQPEPAVLRVLSSVRVLGEGVDSRDCDGVFFCDTRGSMVDIVQMVGRALRKSEGKIATLIVPVFLKEGENPGDILTSSGAGMLATVLEALRAHDTEAIEALADPRVRSGSWSGDEDGQDVDAGAEGDEAGDGGQLGVRERAASLLEFSTPRDPATLAQFVKLRVIEPEREYWRQGVAAATRYVKENTAGQLKVAYDFVTPPDWSPAGFPLGAWLRDQRHAFNAGQLAASRAKDLDALGMVWSHHELAFEEGLAVARSYATVHGHFLPPENAVWQEYPIGQWAKNQRAAGRKALRNIARREAGLPVDATRAMTTERLDLLDDVDPGWCPVWDAGWQRHFQLTKAHCDAGNPVPTEAGEVVVQGDDLGQWVRAQRFNWEQLTVGQRVLLEILGLEPATAEERPVQRTQDDKWALNMAAARQFHGREGHLRVPRKHVEQLAADTVPGRGQDGAGGGVVVKLGMFVDNVRRRADKLTAERRTELDELGMRW
ncbi:Helicase associated domain protein [Streptomyces sp. NPDC050504]|uniref:DEAD/DEAH box helicase n=1 Tax=Streptomyces sp. NPDC050504 TaxID=3365618 RepID=UPI0037A55223